MIKAEQEPAFRIVVICSGNRFRSPITAGLLREAANGLPVEVSSLGTLELGPMPAMPEAVELAAAGGLDISSHLARTIQGEDLSNADLVLGFERIHVATAVVDCDAARERTFTVPELVQLLERVGAPTRDDPIERARETVRRANEERSGNETALAELRDPIDGPASAYPETVERIRELSRRLAAGLFGR